MLSATLDQATGHLAYSVGPGGSANLSSDPAKYVSGVNAMISLLQPVMEQYVVTSRRMAVRLALQGGLASTMQGFAYDVGTDSYHPVDVADPDVPGRMVNRELAPLFEAILRAAPALPAGMDPASVDNPVADYLARWNEILWQIYPDYRPSGAGNLLGGTVSIDQAFIMQMLVAAWERVPVGIDLAGAAHALSIDESRIIANGAGGICNGTATALQPGKSRRVAAANDNKLGAWRGAPFRLLGAVA